VRLRGAHFRICADGTLRGPDNTVAARYRDRLWYLGNSRHGSFECAGPVYLRATSRNGRRDYLGPFTSLRTGDGAIFGPESCLGVHALRAESDSETVDVWREVSLLTSL
jgi:hypothetical protein